MGEWMWVSGVFDAKSNRRTLIEILPLLFRSPRSSLGLNVSSIWLDICSRLLGLDQVVYYLCQFLKRLGAKLAPTEIFVPRQRLHSWRLGVNSRLNYPITALST
jgi:hypothetical protein